MALLLIRHGETDLNAARVVQFPDTPLGECGRRQAERLGLSLADRSIELVLTSDYRRARTTADRVAEHAGADLVESVSLRERNFGEVRGKSYASLGDVDIFAADYQPPGGESWAAFNTRVDTAWNEVTSRARSLSGDLAVVTHGLVLRSLIERVLDVSGYAVEPGLVVANTSVTVVDRDPPWRVIELAGVDHLEDAAGDVAWV
jgi:2,3-bisphosphoglycerate-dependent phosphoglycerate mutase